MRVHIFLLQVSVCLAGCSSSGSATGQIKGKVAFESKPAEGFVVNFIDPKKGVGDGAPIDSQGNFSLTTPLPEGEYTVFLTTPDGPPREPGAPPPPPPVESVNIPKRYRQHQTSDLRAKVAKGSNDFSFDLKP